MGALYQKPLANPSTTHLVAIGLAVAVFCLWVSLVGSILHNFLESGAVREEAKAHEDESMFAELGVVAGGVKDQGKRISETEHEEIERPDKDIVETEDEQPRTPEERLQKIAEEVRRKEKEYSILERESNETVGDAVRKTDEMIANQKLADLQGHAAPITSDERKNSVTWNCQRVWLLYCFSSLGTSGR